MRTENDISNINNIEFSEFLNTALKCGGSHLVASKSHGKTRFLFGMAQELMKKHRVIAFDGSLAWLYWFSKIPVFTVRERDITLTSKLETTEQIERYELNNWQLVKLALQKYDSILFDLRTRKPSKRGFFIRQVINYLDAQQRAETINNENHEPKDYIAYFIEEAQDAFNSRSTTRLEAEEFLTVFNEARNQKEAFFTASQRLNDFSKTIRSKQLYTIGKINIEDKNPFMRRLEKAHGIDFSKMPSRSWFFEGKLLTASEWKQKDRPYKINKAVKAEFRTEQKPKPKQKKTLLEKIFPSIYNARLLRQGKLGAVGTVTEENDTEEESAIIEPLEEF
jgi:hypothetical protein